MGGVIGAAGNDSATTTESVTNTQREVSTKTVPAEAKTKTVTVTEQREPERSEPTEAASGSGETQAFSGNGGKNLGKIEAPTDSILRWTNDGEIFQLFANEFEVLVNSQAHSGNTFLPAGTYKSVTTNAIGNWSIEVVPK